MGLRDGAFQNALEFQLSWYLEPRTISPDGAAEPIRRPAFAIGALSAAIASFLIWLIYFKGKVAAPD
jgi:hypothetical protein